MNIIEVLIKASVSPEFRQAIGSAGDQIKGVEKTVESAASKSKSSFSTVASSIVGSFAGVGLALDGVKKSLDLIWNAGLRQADEFQRLENRIRATGLAGEDLDRVQRSLMETANATRSSYAGTVELFSRLAISSKDLGTSEKELITFTQSLNQAIQLSGASSQEAENGLIQLSQGMASGTLRGDELRSVLEQLPDVADVISEHLGVSRGQLRKMGEDGKITAQVIIESFAAARQELNDRFAAQIPTAGQAAVVFKNQILELAGEHGKGALGQLSAGIMETGNSLEEFKPLLTGVGFVVQSIIQTIRVAFLGLQSFFSGLIPLIIGELGRLLSWSLSTMIGWAEKINGIVGKLLPKTWQDGFAANLASAKDWVGGMGDYFKEVSDQSVGYLDGIGNKMADVYRPREEIDVPGKKAGAGTGGGGADAGAGSDKLTAEQKNEIQITAFLEGQRNARAKHEEELLNKLQKTRANQEKQSEDMARASFERIKSTTFNGAWFAEVDQRIKAIGTGFQQIARTMASVFDNAMNSVGNNLTAVLTGTKSLTQGMKDLGREILQSVVGGIVQAGLKWVQMEVMKATMSKAMAAASLAVTVPIAAAQTAIWTTPATLATIATMGGAAAAAPAEVAGSIAITKALASFEVGTPRVPRDMLAQIHSGEGIIPKNFMDGIRSGELTLGGPGSGGGGSLSASVVLPDDIMSMISQRGSALVKIVKNQGQVAFS